MIHISGWGMNGGELETITKLLAPMVKMMGEVIIVHNEYCVVF